jgi:serine/threonine protein kinase
MFPRAGEYFNKGEESYFDAHDSGSSHEIYYYTPPEQPRITPRVWEECEFAERIDELGISREGFIEAIEELLASGARTHPSVTKLCSKWKANGLLNAKDGELLLYLVLGREIEWNLDSVVACVATSMRNHVRIQEAIAARIESTGISYDTFDLLEREIWNFVETRFAPRKALDLVHSLAPHLTSENVTLETFCQVFGPPKLIAQVGPWASIVALHERKAFIEDFYPLDNVEDFPTEGKLLGESHWGPVRDLGSFNGGLIVKIIKRTKYERRVKGIDRWNDDPASEVATHRYLTSLGHKNLVRFEGVTMDNKNVYYYQEKGVELFSIVKKHRDKFWEQWKVTLETKPKGYFQDHKSLWEIRMTKIFRGIFEGVAFMHANRIVHRDLKLENMVVVGSDGDITGKIIDFGVALRHGEWESDMQNHGKVGTYPFMSPEMCYNKRYVNAAKNKIDLQDYDQYDGAKNDVWTLGHALWGYAMGVLLWQDISNTSDARFTIATRARYCSDPTPWRFRPSGLRYLATRYGENRTSMCTDDLIDLMEHCLSPESERWSAQQCLEHPWFTHTN